MQARITLIYTATSYLYKIQLTTAASNHSPAATARCSAWSKKRLSTEPVFRILNE